ncbi:MAG: serine/threonine protein kinase [Prevotella sp.]|nr:serine/threonine protein kinase [Prevotella sp.]
MKLIVSPEYQSLSEWLAQVPRLFDDNQGELLYKGRNQIRLFVVGDKKKVVVKRYKRHDIIKTLAYTFFRKNKARRSYENAVSLTQRGFHTPQAVAYMECTTAGLMTQVYYVCAYTDSEPIRPRLIEQEPFDEALAVAYARYVARLHEAGVLHRDLNPTNVLFRHEHGGYDFELIDINRMQFFDSPVPKAACMENLTLFYWLTPAYRFILNEYARQRGWTEADIAEAIRVKERHDRRWVRRKKITHPFRK